MRNRWTTAALASGAVYFYLRVRRERERAERLAAAALETLLNAIDANDPQTGAHVRRVARYSLILARAYGLDSRERRSVERVALFHDIGKIQEALFDIVHDATSLSPTERRLIATHPRRGAEVLAPLSFFYPHLGEAVLAHHERWDGTGYPRGLRGKAIPLAARIVAVADTFDAITRQRRYKRPRTIPEAAEIIAAERGKQFDPDITDTFLSPPVIEAIGRAFHRRATSNRRNPPVIAGPGALEDGEVADVEFRWRSGRQGP